MVLNTNVPFHISYHCTEAFFILYLLTCSHRINTGLLAYAILVVAVVVPIFLPPSLSPSFFFFFLLFEMKCCREKQEYANQFWWLHCHLSIVKRKFVAN